MNTEKDSNKVEVAIIGFLIFASHGLNFLGWNNFVPRKYYLFVSLILVLLFFRLYKYVRQVNPYFLSYVSFLCVWPIVPFVYSVLSGEDPQFIFQTTLQWTICSVFFFVFYRYKVREKNIIIAFTSFAFITAIIQIVQQIYPEIALFGVMDQSKDGVDIVAVQRNGLYRFHVGKAMVQIFCFCYYWNKSLNKPTIKNISLLCLFAISIYLYLTRQIIIAVVMACCLSLIFTINSKFKIIAVVFVGIGYYLISRYWDILFADFVSSYRENTYSTDVRMEFIQWIIAYFANNPLDFILGQGRNSFIRGLEVSHEYFLSDIGFLGEIFMFGIPWGLAYLGVLYIFFFKIRKSIPEYIKLYVLVFAMVAIFIFPYRDLTEMCVWISLIYISSLHVDERYELTE